MLYDPSHFVLQQLKYLDYIDIYHERIKMFHVKDAEFNPTGRQGVYGGFQTGSTGPGVSARLETVRSISLDLFEARRPTTYAGWAVLEWECAHEASGGWRARKERRFIADYIIRVTERAFDDFASSGTDRAANRKMLGLDRKGRAMA